MGRETAVFSGSNCVKTPPDPHSLVVWFGKRSINWARPVVIEVDARKVFEGTLERNLAVCLARAAATRDFDRLRWAGVRVDRSGTATAITAEAVPLPAWRQDPRQNQ